MKNDFIKKFILQGIEKDLKKDVTSKKYTCKKTIEYDLKRIDFLSEKLVKSMLKNSIKYLSKNLKKAIEKGDIDKIEKLEKSVNNSIDLLRKDKIKDETSTNSKQIYINSKETIINHVLNYYNIKMYKLNKNKYLIKEYIEKLNIKKANYKTNNKNEYKKAYYKSLKPIYKTILKSDNKGYRLEYKNDFLDLQSQAKIYIIEYLQKYNKTIVYNSRLLKNRIVNNLLYMYRKIRIHSKNNQISLDNEKYSFLEYHIKDYSLDNINTIQNIQFKKLSNREKEIIELKKQKYTFYEISQILNCNVNTIKTLFYRIKNKIYLYEY